MIYETFSAFSPCATKLRAHFDERFADPRHSSPDRFVWDYWHIPDQYTFLRTPAFQYFPETLYRKFHSHLVQWGREYLGCHDVSPTWLSCYVEGCQQSLHRDQPHGPLAFVFSLTKNRKLQGGNTMILKSDSPAFLEKSEMFHSLPPVFNRLIVFDPALIHGVDEVRGVRDPRDARLVLHGWFVNPRVFWFGKLTAKQVGRVLDQQLTPTFTGFRGVEGFCSWRLKVSANGGVTDVRSLVTTLKGDQAAVMRILKRQLGALRFPKGRSSTVTVPLTFTD